MLKMNINSIPVSERNKLQDGNQFQPMENGNKIQDAVIARNTIFAMPGSGF